LFRVGGLPTPRPSRLREGDGQAVMGQRLRQQDAALGPSPEAERDFAERGNLAGMRSGYPEILPKNTQRP
jgi:hypothetical protein